MPKSDDYDRQSRRSLRRLLMHMQIQYPTLYPVQLEFKEIADAWGHCRVKVPKDKKKPKKLVVAVETRASPTLRFFIFVHEYAHAMQWRSDHQEVKRINDHDSEWGILYATIWDYATTHYDLED